MTEDDFIVLEQLIRSAIASVCIGELTPAICDLAQALAMVDEEI